MADSYLSIAAIASDQFMAERMNAAATQQSYLGNVAMMPSDPLTWVSLNRYVWASSPGWGAAWDSALAAHPPETEPDYEPGKDSAVITDGQILSAVQVLGGAPAAYQAEHEAPEPEREDNQAAAVADENANAPA